MEIPALGHPLRALAGCRRPRQSPRNIRPAQQKQPSATTGRAARAERVRDACVTGSRSPRGVALRSTRARVLARRVPLGPRRGRHDAAPVDPGRPPAHAVAPGTSLSQPRQRSGEASGSARVRPFGAPRTPRASRFIAALVAPGSLPPTLPSFEFTRTALASSGQLAHVLPTRFAPGIPRSKARLATARHRLLSSFAGALTDRGPELVAVLPTRVARVAPPS